MWLASLLARAYLEAQSLGWETSLCLQRQHQGPDRGCFGLQGKSIAFAFLVSSSKLRGTFWDLSPPGSQPENHGGQRPALALLWGLAELGERLTSERAGLWGGGSWALQNTSSSVCLGSGVGTPCLVRDARHVWVVPSCLLQEDLGAGRDLLLCSTFPL